MLLVRQLFGSSSNSWVRALIIFVLAWAVLVYVFVLKLTNNNNNNNNNGINNGIGGIGMGMGGASMQGLALGQGQGQMSQLTTAENELNVRRINQALQLLEHTKQRNEELKQLIDELMRLVICEATSGLGEVPSRFHVVASQLAFVTEGGTRMPPTISLPYSPLSIHMLKSICAVTLYA